MVVHSLRPFLWLPTLWFTVYDTDSACVPRGPWLILRSHQTPLTRRRFQSRHVTDRDLDHRLLRRGVRFLSLIKCVFSLSLIRSVFFLSLVRYVFFLVFVLRFPRFLFTVPGRLAFKWNSNTQMSNSWDKNLSSVPIFCFEQLKSKILNQCGLVRKTRLN